MKRRDFLKTIAVVAAVAGLGGLAPGDSIPAVEPGTRNPKPETPELPIHGNPYAFASGAHGEFAGVAGDYWFDPIAAHALPPEWRDRYLLGIGA